MGFGGPALKPWQRQRGIADSPQNPQIGSKSSCSSPWMCKTGCRIPTTSSTNQEDAMIDSLPPAPAFRKRLHPTHYSQQRAKLQGEGDRSASKSLYMVPNSGCEGEGAGFQVRVLGSWFRVQGSGFRVPGLRLMVEGSGFRVEGSEFRFQGSGFKVQGSGRGG